MTEKAMMTKGDRLIFCLLFFGALLSIFLCGLLFSGETGRLAVVEIDGRRYGEYSLQEKDGKTLEIMTEFGYNKIVIENGAVRVTESSCPDGDEMAAGSISETGEMLVCLPNRVMIRITGEKEVDGLVY